MIIFRLQLADAISWRLKREDPYSFAIPGSPDWQLVSPLLYHKLDLHRGSAEPTFVAPGEYLVISSDIVAVGQSERALRVLEEFRGRRAPPPKEILDAIDQLLLWLRHAAGQATVPRSTSFQLITLAEIESLPAFAAEAADDAVTSIVREYCWASAITADNLRAVASHPAGFGPPTCEVLFLDAVAAHERKDFRTSVLYAWISIEIAFGEVIDREYSRIISSPDDDKFRVSPRTLPGGRVIYKDPIYERLCSRDNFEELINERAVYVLRKSLLAENQELYGRAKRLYSTRNRLAHSGGLGDADPGDTLTLDESGSRESLETAIALFLWLGIRANYVVPRRSFIDPKTRATFGY